MTRHHVRIAAALVAVTYGLFLPAGDVLAQAAPVATARSETAPILHRVELSGTVVAPRAARVSSAIAGLVEEMQVDLGMHVPAGEPLLRLDDELERLELQRAEAATREGREALADARRRLEDGRQLTRREALPQNELEGREAEVRIAEARVARLQAEEAHRRERVRRHVISAPFAGVVARRIAEAGEWVSPGTAVIELVETERLRIDVPVPQRHYPGLADEPEITLRFAALPGQSFDARVLSRVPVSDPTSRTFTLRLRPARDDLALTPGMSADVTLHLATGERGVVIPRDAVIRHPDGRVTVWVTERREGGAPTAAERAVQLGRTFDGRVHVRAGLEAGVRVVVRGNESLSAGQRVKPAGTEG